MAFPRIPSLIIAVILLGLASCTDGIGPPERPDATMAGALKPNHTVIFNIAYSFGIDGIGPGVSPEGSVLATSSGDLFGTTSAGGSYSYGTVFELIPQSGMYSLNPIYAFKGSDGRDGSAPQSGLIEDSNGAIYGTTSSGGADYGGTVFKLAPNGKGYAESVIHSFPASASDGTEPGGCLLLGSDGKTIIGTTASGGGHSSSGSGVVYKLVPSGSAYKETIIYTFSGGADGGAPACGVTADGSGDFFGSAAYGGARGAGTVFELIPQGSKYTETTLHTFPETSNDGDLPNGPLLMDNNGNLYGATYDGGAHGRGMAFELAKGSNYYLEKVLHAFAGPPKDGEYPSAGLTFGSNNNTLYGTTGRGGKAKAQAGTIFVLQANSKGYAEKVLHSFAGPVKDGANPAAALTLGTSGQLIGTTVNGGSSKSLCNAGCGTVFTLLPY